MYVEYAMPYATHFIFTSKHLVVTFSKTQPLRLGFNFEKHSHTFFDLVVFCIDTSVFIFFNVTYFYVELIVVATLV